MEIEFFHSIAEDFWRNYVDQHPDGCIFHTPEMFQVFAKSLGHRPIFLAAVQGDNLIALLTSVQISLLGGLFCSFTTRAVAYGGALCVPGQENMYIFEKLLLRYISQIGNRILFTELRNLSDYRNLQSVLQKTGFRFEEHNNYIVDLALPQTEVWRKIHKSARKNIRKAERMDLLSIQEIDNKQILPQWYHVIKKSFSWNHAYFSGFLSF